MCKNQLLDLKFEELDKHIDSIEDKNEELISILHKAQNIFGYLSEDTQLYISRKLDIPAVKVNGVVSFYSYFKENPVGEYTISICLGTACFVKGADKVLEEFEKILNIKSGETTPDGKFSIDSLRCIGACGLAPVISINDKIYARVKVEEVSEILKNYEQ